MKKSTMSQVVGLLSIVFLTVCLAMPAFAASSKFAAHVSDPGSGAVLLHSGISSAGDDPASDASDDSAEILHAVIKTANKKDLLIGVSLQSGLYTDTKVKGKNGSSESAGAMGGVEVEILIDDQPVFPAKVVFAKRYQTLTAVLGGVIESCEVSCTTNPDTLETTCSDIVIADDCVVLDEEIGLILETTSANHFNFVAPNLAPGEHDVRVNVTAKSSADVAGTDGNEATGWAVVELGSLTVEEVRATNNPDGITIDLD